MLLLLLLDDLMQRGMREWTLYYYHFFSMMAKADSSRWPWRNRPVFLSLEWSCGIERNNRVRARGLANDGRPAEKLVVGIVYMFVIVCAKHKVASRYSLQKSHSLSMLETWSVHFPCPPDLLCLFGSEHSELCLSLFLLSRFWDIFSITFLKKNDIAPVISIETRFRYT